MTTDDTPDLARAVEALHTEAQWKGWRLRAMQAAREPLAFENSWCRECRKPWPCPTTEALAAHRPDRATQPTEAAQYRCVGCGGPLIQDRPFLRCERCSLAARTQPTAEPRTESAWNEGYRAGWDDRNEDEVNPLPAGEQHDTANPYDSEAGR